MLSLIFIFISPECVRAVSDETYQSNESTEMQSVPSKVYVSEKVIFLKGQTVAPSYYISKNVNGLYYSGWVSISSRTTNIDGSTTAVYSGYIYGGLGTNLIVLKD